MVLAVLVIVLAGCEGRRQDPLTSFAAASCASIQTWIDAVEDEATRLSRAVRPLDRASERVEHHREFARAVDLRTWDLQRQLRRIAPATGDARRAADAVLAALDGSRRVTTELVVLADGFPDGDDDPEPLVSRISSLFVRLEKAFVYPKQARDALAERHDAFARAPACVDYAEAVT